MNRQKNSYEDEQQINVEYVSHSKKEKVIYYFNINIFYFT